MGSQWGQRKPLFRQGDPRYMGSSLWDVHPRINRALSLYCLISWTHLSSPFSNPFSPSTSNGILKPLQWVSSLYSSLFEYFLTWFSFFSFSARHNKIPAKDPNALQPEARLYRLLYLAPLEIIELFDFTWFSLESMYHVHFIALIIFLLLIDAANYVIYMITIDYITPLTAYTPPPQSTATPSHVTSSPT